MSFKDFSYLELWQHHCLEEQNHLCNFGRWHHEKQFCVIILNLDKGFRRRGRLNRFLSRALVTPLFSRVEPFVQFWYHEEQICDIDTVVLIYRHWAIMAHI